MRYRLTASLGTNHLAVCCDAGQTNFWSWVLCLLHQDPMVYRKFGFHLIVMQSSNRPLHKFIFSMKLPLQISRVLSTFSIVNPFLNRTQDEKRAFS